MQKPLKFLIIMAVTSNLVTLAVAIGLTAEAKHEVQTLERKVRFVEMVAKVPMTNDEIQVASLLSGSYTYCMDIRRAPSATAQDIELYSNLPDQPDFLPIIERNEGHALRTYLCGTEDSRLEGSMKEDGIVVRVNHEREIIALTNADI